VEGAAQLDWLRRDLQQAAANREAVPWIIVASHFPIYCSSVSLNGVRQNDTYNGTLPELSPKLQSAGKSYRGCIGAGEEFVETSRADLEPLLLEFGVDVYFGAHMHAYESTWPVKNNTKQADNFINPTAPVHITTGAGGAPGWDTFGDNWGPWTRKQIVAWGYGRLVAYNASMLSYTHVLNANSSVVDEVLIQQQKHGPFL
jgi:hypothetical protein